MLKFLRVPKKPFSLPWNLEGECNWTKWRRFAKRRYPVRYFLSETIPHFWEYTICWNLRDLKYKIKDWFFPHNVLKLKSLPRSWCDRDLRLLHACFQLLSDWVEIEQPYMFEATREEYIKSHTWQDDVCWDKVGARDALRELYAWWKEYRDSERYDEAEEQSMLHKLIKYRRHLWS